MLIVGENLRELISQYGIAPKESYDDTCISLTLDDQIMEYDIPKEMTVEYDSTQMRKRINKTPINKADGYVLEPKSCVLACSAEKICMPVFCFGMLQTKGSLGRLFVFLNCADGQVDPGYNGKITFELFNAADFRVRIKPGQVVGNLYLFKTSTIVDGYKGRYQFAEYPTFSLTK